MPLIVEKEPHWFEITWDPVPGAELYVAGMPDDIELWWLTPLLVRAGEPLRIFTDTASVRITAIGPGGTSSSLPRRRAARR